MDADALQALVALVDEGSVLAASERLGVSRATIRRRVEALEAHIGVRLLDRRSERAVLTSPGVAVIDHARRLLDDFGTLAHVARTAELSARVGPLRIVAPTGMPPEVVVQMIRRGCELYPDVRLDIRFCADPMAERAEEVDLYIHFGPATPRGAFVSKVFLRMPERLVATRAYLDAHGAPSGLDDLGRHALLTWTPPRESPRRWPLLDGDALEVDPLVASPDVHVVRRLMLDGLGVARLPEGGVPDPGFRGELVTLFPEAFGRECTLRLLVPEALSRTPRLRSVMSLIEAGPEA